MIRDFNISEEHAATLHAQSMRYLHWEDGEIVHLLLLCRYMPEQKKCICLCSKLTLYKSFWLAYCLMLSAIGAIITAWIFLPLYSSMLCIGLCLLLAYVVITKFIQRIKQYERYHITFSNCMFDTIDADCISAIDQEETILSFWKPWDSLKSIYKIIVLEHTSRTKHSSELLRLSKDVVNNINSIAASQKMRLLGCYVVESNKFVKVV